MEKQTKNIITREWLEKELRFYNTGYLKAGLFTFVIVFFTCVPLCAFFIWLIVSSLDNLFLEIAGSVLFGGMFIVPIVFTALEILKTLSERKKLTRGEFDVVTCELSYKTERVTRRHTILLLNFPGFHEKQVDKTTYFHAGIGDEFYVVCYRTESKKQKKKAIKLLYSAKMYEYAALN